MTLETPWPLPAVVVAHHITYDGHPDSYPLHIASKVLSDGQSSRIYQKLVYEKQIAVAAFGGANLIEDPNLFYAVAIVQPGQHAGGGGQRADRRARAAEGRADQRARAAAHQEPVRARLHPRPRVEPAEGDAAGARRVIHNDIKTADGEFDIFQNITAADVQRVARTYFTPENRLVLTLMPSGEGRPMGRASDRRSRVALAASCCAGALGCVVAARGADRATGRPSGRRGRCRRATSSSRPTRSGRCRTGCRSSPCCTTSSRSSACGMLVRAGSALDPKGQARARAARRVAARPGHDDAVGAAR